MRPRFILFFVVAVLVAGLYLIPNPHVHEAKREAASSTHPRGKTTFVTVAPGVDLEVIDYGGNGRNMVLLAGLGTTAHAFDGFGPKLATRYHVYAITRRGFGNSSAPSSGYSATRLGQDVVAVIDALKLDRPILVGHSVGGEEVSAVASQSPEKCGGAVYLDAGYDYALYNVANGSQVLNYTPLLGAVLSIAPPCLRQPKLMIVGQAEKFIALPVPVLAVFACPHNLSSQHPNDTAAELQAEQADEVRVNRQVAAFERQVPSATIVRIPRASHAVYVSHEQAVLDAINQFVTSLDRKQR